MPVVTRTEALGSSGLPDDKDIRVNQLDNNHLTCIDEMAIRGFGDLEVLFRSLHGAHLARRCLSRVVLTDAVLDLPRQVRKLIPYRPETFLRTGSYDV
uniref:Uncharacterized protein n=1 Tax=Timema douglasi TaxID=61478 RepID=A0A7R8VBR1_TIMDO|nr:unnamed protein product [Timema douglasi]